MQDRANGVLGGSVSSRTRDTIKGLKGVRGTRGDAEIALTKRIRYIDVEGI